MPNKYLVETAEGKKFNVEFDKEPSNEELNRAVADLSKPGTVTKAPPKWVEPGRSAAEITGLLGGGAAGTFAGPAGQVAGAGLGYSGMRQAYDRAMELVGVQKPETTGEAFKKAGIDVLKGGAAEAGGQALPKIIEKAATGLTYPWGAYTGSGSEALKEAYKGKPEFTKFMRKQAPLTDIVGEAKSGLSALKEMRASEYTPALEKVKVLKQDLDLKPLYKELDNQMKAFNITKATGGGFDYSNSVLEADPAAQKEFESIHDMIMKRQAGEVTIKPKDVDILKRNLADYYSQNDKIRSLTTNLHNKTRSILEDSIPEYKEMTAKYAKDTELIREVEKDFSLGTKSSSEQGLVKLTNAINENKQFKQDLLNIIKEKTGKDIMPMIAGSKMSSIIPTSLVGRMGGMYEVFRMWEKIDPKIAAAMAMSSPRLTGEFLNALGKVGPTVIKGARYAPQAILALPERTQKKGSSELNKMIKDTSQKVGITP
jgi:hypothetical protein